MRFMTIQRWRGELDESNLIAMNILFWSGAELGLKFREVSVDSIRTS